MHILLVGLIAVIALETFIRVIVPLTSGAAVEVGAPTLKEAGLAFLFAMLSMFMALAATGIAG